jgi:HAD superfamily hydrolase (TIGR01509 family)
MKTSRFKTVIFDMDGVLINSVEMWINVGLEGLKEINITATRKDMIKGVVKFETIKKLGVPDIGVYGKRINEMFVEKVTDIQPQENIIKLLEKLKERELTMGVVTTSGREAVSRILKNLSLEKYFEIVITHDDVTRHKPDPEGVFKAMKALKADPNTTLIIGDTRNDILAGKAAGITTVLYYPQCHAEIYDRDHLLALSADYYICDLLDAVAIIES